MVVRMEEHLFYGSLKVYCIALDENYQGADNEVDGTPSPKISRSGQPIRYAPPTDYPLIGYDAPTLIDVAAGKKRKMTSTKKMIQKTPGSSNRTLTIASAPDADASAYASPPRSEDIATEDMDEDNVQEIAPQTSPIIQIQHLPSKRARTTASPIQQTSSIVQESPVIPQDVLPDPGVSTLPLISSSAPITNEVPRIQAAMEQSKRDLEAKRDRLIKELEHVNQETADVDNRLYQLPIALQQLEVEKQEQARQTYQLHKSIKTIPGSAEANVQEIQIADDIHLRAISVIQNALGPS
ncbi:uncharacterized protein LOC120653311 [Panicum virgatum]|uniref:uncharacterized protein LOC120653311 n=1 Tax=Panicum virgatum TaxID=38727 RepID=UPI0019D569FC|nr:uncharacterized protein LOC120653311 [Panicum virgatum]